MSRFEPETKEEAFMYQFQDTMDMLKHASKTSPKAFRIALSLLKTQIKSYERTV